MTISASTAFMTSSATEDFWFAVTLLLSRNGQRLVIWTEGQLCCTGDWPSEQVKASWRLKEEVLNASAMQLLLAIDAKCRGLKIALQFKLNAVPHPPRAGSAGWSIRPGFAFDPAQFVFGVGIESL